MLVDPLIVNPHRTPSRTLLSASVFPPISQFRVPLNATLDRPTLLPWKNFCAEELPVARKTGRVADEYSIGRDVTGTRVFSRNSLLRTATCAWSFEPRETVPKVSNT